MLSATIADCMIRLVSPLALYEATCVLVAKVICNELRPLHALVVEGNSNTLYSLNKVFAFCFLFFF